MQIFCSATSQSLQSLIFSISVTFAFDVFLFLLISDSCQTSYGDKEVIMEMVMMMTPFSKNQTIACLLNYKIFQHCTSNHPQCVKEAQSLCSIRHSTSSHHHQHNIGWFWSPDKRQKNPLRCVQVGHCVLCPSDTALCPTNCCGNIAAHRWTSLSTDQRLRTHIYKRSRVKFTKLRKKFRNVQKQAEVMKIVLKLNISWFPWEASVV